MPLTVEREAKAERIELRVTPSAKALLQAAANARHTTVTDFVLATALSAAEGEITTPRVFHATDKVWDTIQAILETESDAPSTEVLDWLNKSKKE